MTIKLPVLTLLSVVGFGTLIFEPLFWLNYSTLDCSKETIIVRFNSSFLALK